MSTGNALVDRLTSVYTEARRMGYGHQTAERMVIEEFERANPTEYEKAKMKEAVQKAIRR